MSTIEKYLKSSNSQEREYCYFWLTSFGIQSVVSLKPSEHLFPIISRHIEGEIDLPRTHQEVHDFYHLLHKESGSHQIHHEEETDKVAVRIVEILMSDDFDLSPEGFANVHRHMFHGIYHNSGKFREHTASKKEWVLANSTVIYPPSDQIEAQLDYLFSVERNTNYDALSESHRLQNYSNFIARLFMVNAFQYANSRTTFVYALKYLLSRGYRLRNDTFYREAWYFRNAIVRACYTNMHQGVYPTTQYLVMFLRNLLFDEDNELKNHRMMVKGD